jgi:uncharacterized protein (TIGR03083 family)
VGERDDVMDALHGASARFIELVASLEPVDATRPVAGLDWNVGETIAHVLTVVRRGFADRRRSAAAAETASLNELCLEETPERDPRALAELLRADVHTALDIVFPKIPDDREFAFHGGVTTTMTPALHVVLGEFVIHGYDVARAVDRPWPITDREARLLVPGELLGAWLRPDSPDEAYELRLGDGTPIRFEIRGGSLLVGPGTGTTVVAMDPVEFVLGFYNRVPVTDPGLARLQSRFVPA